MEDKKERIIRNVKMAASSIRMEGLPLTDEFVETYLKKKLEEIDKEENNKKKIKK